MGDSSAIPHRWSLWWLASPLLLVASLVVNPSAGACQSAKTALKPESHGRAQVRTLAELKRKLKTATLTVNDPTYGGRKKTYEGFWLKDVLAVAGLDASSGDEIAFRCADGYTPTMLLANL